MNDSFPDLSAQRRCVVLFGSPAFTTAVLVCLLRLFCSCRFFSPTVSLTVHLPPAPVHWQESFTQFDFRILYPAPESGGFEERLVDSRAPVVIQLPKVLYVPVLAYPTLSGRSIELPPAGGVYPLDCDITANTILLSWQQGATAEVLYRLWKQGVDCSAVNVPRLSGEMSSRSLGDPWALDSDRICTRMAAEAFRLTDIRPAPCRDLRLEPGSGQWFLESPFRKPVQAQADGSLILEAVPLGNHILFEYPAGACYFLYVEEETSLMIRR